MKKLLDRTLAQLEALGTEKMRAQNRKKGAGDEQFGVLLGTFASSARSSRLTTSWGSSYGRPGTSMPGSWRFC
jgi:hypothetical protein